MNKFIKKIIAREEQILGALGILFFLGIASFVLGMFTIGKLAEIGMILFVVATSLALIYLLIRLIIWAIKALGEK